MRYFMAVLLLGLELQAVASTRTPTVMSTSASRPSASRSSGNIGLGVMFGEPTGLTFKRLSKQKTAFDIGLTYSFDEFFEILGDYLWHFPRVFASAGAHGSEFVPYL